MLESFIRTELFLRAGFVPPHSKLGEDLIIFPVILDSFTYQFFTQPGTIDGCRIDGGDTQIISTTDGSDGLLLITSSPHKTTDSPGSKGNSGYWNAALSQFSVNHSLYF